MENANAVAALLAEPSSAGLTPAELRRFLELGVAQLDAAIKDADGNVDKLTRSVSQTAQLSGEIATLIGRHEVNDQLLDLSVKLGDAVHQAIIALQFYDKLIQRLAHVRDGLAIPATAVERAALTNSDAWKAVAEQVRMRYSMVEERVMFDFLIHGTGATQMLRALTDFRSATRGAELDLF